MVHYQEHDKFKIFTGADARDISEAIASFIKESGKAAKSLGAEYLENSGKLVVTLGYTDKEQSYPVAVSDANVGKFEAEYVSETEAAIADAANKLERIICHCPYIDDRGDMHILFLVHRP
jgi:hypothetical protein